MVYETADRKFKQTAHNVEIAVKVSFPAGANVEPIYEKIRETLAFAAEDPDQLGLGLDDGDPPSPTPDGE